MLMRIAILQVWLFRGSVGYDSLWGTLYIRDCVWWEGGGAQRYDTFHYKYTLFVSTLGTLEADIYILARASTCVLKV